MKQKNYNLGELFDCNIKEMVYKSINLYSEIFFLIDENDEQSIEIN